jgi:hypothetical protein
MMMMSDGDEGKQQIVIKEGNVENLTPFLQFFFYSQLCEYDR